jgi:hypothetical protein
MLEFLVCGCGGNEETFLVTVDMLDLCPEVFVGLRKLSQDCKRTQRSIYR